MASISSDSRPRWRRRLAVALKRSAPTPALDIAAGVALLAVIIGSYFVISNADRAQAPLTPQTVAMLLMIVVGAQRMAVEAIPTV